MEEPRHQPVARQFDSASVKVYELLKSQRS
jgi:hypothetical protein